MTGLASFDVNSSEFTKTFEASLSLHQQHHVTGLHHQTPISFEDAIRYGLLLKPQSRNDWFDLISMIHSFSVVLVGFSVVLCIMHNDAMHQLLSLSHVLLAIQYHPDHIVESDVVLLEQWPGHLILAVSESNEDRF